MCSSGLHPCLSGQVSELPEKTLETQLSFQPVRTHQSEIKLN
jgi:hypothetical protein